jgi:ribosomal protein L7/L12
MLSSNQKEDRLDRISNALLAGRKIEAIKAYQEMTGLGLRECKEAIDAMEASLKIKQPESFSAKQKSPVPCDCNGCGAYSRRSCLCNFFGN